MIFQHGLIVLANVIMFVLMEYLLNLILAVAAIVITNVEQMVYLNLLILVVAKKED